MQLARTTNPQHVLSAKDRIKILLAEYQSLNALLLFRLTALDRRLPVTAGFLTAAVASSLALPLHAQPVVLVATPAAMLWLVRTTLCHAFAKEDHLRRIDEIERAIDAIAGEQLLVFQSQHSSRGQFPAGRSGLTAILAVSSAALLIVVLCLLQFLVNFESILDWLYVCYVVGVAVAIIVAPVQLVGYSYRRK